MFKTNNLLAVSTDAKTVKGVDNGVLTGIMYFAPHSLSGFQVCPKASPECKAACLYTAGRGVYNAVQQGRLNKTKWFFSERDTFMAKLVENIASLEKRAKKNKMVPAVRLNGTSDIAWEKISCVRDGKVYASVIDAFPNVQFYDYTKIIGRKRALQLPNYHLTFSLSEENDSDAVLALQQGYNVAVVIKSKRKAEKPATWGGYPTVDGDVTDIRFRDPKGGHVVLLRAKGKAEKMQDGGFIRKVDGKFNTKSLQLKLVA